jgi:hypothetical protein
MLQLEKISILNCDGVTSKYVFIATIQFVSFNF